MPAFFITATGTDIGKTFVAAGLLSALRAGGRKVAALKPVLTGFDPENFAESDPAVLIAACGEVAGPGAIAKVSPWRFRAPLSPDMAAAREGRKIDSDAVIQHCQSAVANAEDMLLIEGIGGLMVPLNAQTTVCDLAAALNLPTLLVTGTYLGALSHTLCTLAAAQAHGLPVAGLVLNETPDSPVSLAATRESLANFWPGRIFELPRNPPAALFRNLAEFLTLP